MNSTEKYLEEFAKYKHIVLDLDAVYVKKSRTTEKMKIVEINKNESIALVKNLRTGTLQHKTLHWCRKHLIKE